jgi:glycosyltransferase involved in cell wall biosynthesis
LNLPQVSVLIRVRDEAEALRQVLQELRKQVVDVEVEVVVLDNGSRDATRAVAIEAGARLFTFPRELFGYGRALNLGIELCRGGIVVLLSAHSVPQTSSWLAETIEPLMSNTPIGAVFCRQIPAEPISRLERHRFACFPSENTVRNKQWLIDRCAAGQDPYEAAIFSSSACAFRKEVVLRNPFRDLMYAEDRAFVVDYLFDGGEVAYLTGPCVAYRRPITIRSAYHVAYRAQVSKRLIRELAAIYSGYSYNSSLESASRLLRALFVVPVTFIKVVMCAFEPRGLRWRGMKFAVRSSGSTLGLAKGVLFWKRHAEKLNRDSLLMNLAREQCQELEIESPPA